MPTETNAAQVFSESFVTNCDKNAEKIPWLRLAAVGHD
jgi:hypothetical protein